MGERVALIFGASGVSGWAVTRELLRYPTQTTFSRVIALSNRPLAREAVQLDDSRLELYSGVDLTKPVDVVVKSLREKVPGVDEVTHVYWYAYIHAPTDGDLVEVNGGLLDTTLHVLREAAPHMEHFLWQTGAKYYGVLFPETIPQVPLKESLPRRPEPEASSIFYYRQLDVIASHAKSARWKWNDVRPDAVVGYAPTTNAMNIALVLGVYLALYRAVYGRGASIPCPSNIAGARASNTESPADHLSRCAIWLSLRGGSSLSGQSFNVGVEPSTYAQRWALLADAWGLKGTEAQGEDTDYLRMGNDIAKWASEHATAWQKLEQDHGLKQGVLSATGFDFLGVMSIPTDRQLDTTAIEQAGWNEKGDALAAYKEAWARFAEAKFIPPV